MPAWKSTVRIVLVYKMPRFWAFCSHLSFKMIWLQFLSSRINTYIFPLSHSGFLDWKKNYSFSQGHFQVQMHWRPKHSSSLLTSTQRNVEWTTNFYCLCFHKPFQIDSLRNFRNPWELWGNFVSHFVTSYDFSQVHKISRSKRLKQDHQSWIRLPRVPKIA